MENENKDLCVVLLNYKTPSLVKDCLDTLLPQVRKLSASIVLVDNNSPDDSISCIRDWIARNSAEQNVRLIASQENGGFAAGNNIGISSENAEYYLLVNSDTLFAGGALTAMLAAISEDKKVGLLSPRLQWPDGIPQESCFRYHRPISQMISSSGVGIIRQLFSGFEVARRVCNSDADCEWTSFACVMVRKKVFDEIGLLDDEFFMYFEDVEFCKRATAAGWIIRNHPLARVVHLRGGSSPVKANKSQRKRQAKYFYESRTRYFYLLYGRFGLLRANLFWTLGWLIACTRSVFQRRFSPPVCKCEWKDIWTNFFRPNRPYTHPDASK